MITRLSICAAVLVLGIASPSKVTISESNDISIVPNNVCAQDDDPNLCATKASSYCGTAVNKYKPTDQPGG